MQRDWVYLSEHGGMRIADRFLDAVEKTSFLLLQTPLMGTIGQSSKRQIQGLRRFPVRLPFGTWIILYVPTARGITILRVVHGNRHPDLLLP